MFLIVSNINLQKITIEFYNKKTIDFELEKTDFNELLSESDIITVHIPKQKQPLINAQELEKMKKGAFIINTSRGGVINETDLMNKLNTRHIQCAALDVFENEPNPKLELLMNEYISLSPHIGASTLEAQNRIGIELAEQIKKLLNG